MEKREISEGIRVCINETLTDDELREILSKLESHKDKDEFGLVCKRWLHLQSTERKKLCARAGPLMLRKMAARFSRVMELDLSQSMSRSFFPGVTDSDLSVIASGFSCLRILNLRNCKSVTDTGMIALATGLPCLQYLDVSSCRKITDKGLAAVAQRCSNLRSLHLANCKSITDGLFQALSENCPHLEELGLQSCINITDSGLLVLIDGCRNIKFLDVNKCNKIGDASVSRVSRACPSLRMLKLLDCYRVGDESVFSLAESCKNLETLVIGGCRDITDDSVKSLAIACRYSLKHLQMEWCSNITDVSLNCVLEQCRNLEVLDVGCCDEVTDVAFQGLGRAGFDSSLKTVRVSNCSRITVLGIGLLLDFCKSLEYLDVRSCPHVTKVGCDQAGLQFPEFCKVNFQGSLSEMDTIIDNLT